MIAQRMQCCASASDAKVLRQLRLTTLERDGHVGIDHLCLRCRIEQLATSPQPRCFVSGHTDGGGCATRVARPAQPDIEVPIDEKLPSQLFGSPAQPCLPWLYPAQASQDGAWPICCLPVGVLHMMCPHALVPLRVWQCVLMLIAAQCAAPMAAACRHHAHLYREIAPQRQCMLPVCKGGALSPGC